MLARRLAAVLLSLSLPVVGCSEEATADLPDAPVVDTAVVDTALADTALADAPAPEDAVDASPLDAPDAAEVALMDSTSDADDATTVLDAPAADLPDVPAVDAPADVPPDAPTDAPSVDAPTVDTPDAVDAPSVDTPAAVDAPPSRSNIRHVVVIVQENHTFDSYFGRYCTAPAGSNPTCTEGPSCCEAAPAREPSGASPINLTDSANGSYDPNHSRACESSEIHGGLMDRFVRGASCSDARNFAVAAPATVATYHRYAREYAIADRYFQPIVGATSSNDMYLAVARMVFHDNEVGPQSIGRLCSLFVRTAQYNDPTVADLVLGAGETFAHYAEGYSAARAVNPFCALPPSDCPAHRIGYPCSYDQSDVPFQYYRRFTDNQTWLKDYGSFASDVTARRLPAVAFVKALGYRTEHPGSGTRISDGQAFVDGVVQRVMSSPYADDTLILVTWDEGGGYFDHVSPPPESAVDHEAPGTRVPLIAIGRFARRNVVSHVPMEHSSIVRFLEWNFTGATGQLHARDAVVNNIGSLLDPATTGVAVPEH